VRAAPNREMVVDRRVSPWGGGETVTATIGNAMRTAAARSPVWTRVGKMWGACDARVAVAVGGGERGGREESAAWQPTHFETDAGEAREG
jgi:hypothetical protein